MTKPRLNENAIKRKLHPSSGIAVDIEYIEKTLTKTWSLNRMEVNRYTKRMRDNTYVWLTDLVKEVKELREVKCEAESLIQQKDAEIAKVKNMLLDAIGSLTMYGNDACEEQARRIARDLRELTHVQPGQASLLQDEGDTP